MRLPLLSLFLILPSCGNHSAGGMTGPTMNNRVQKRERHHLESSAILDRSQQAAAVEVRHILIGYKGLSKAYKGKIDPRAKERTRKQAEELVKSLQAKLEAGTPFIALMIDHSEDAGSAKTAQVYHVEAAAEFEPAFIELSLRLRTNEVGVVMSSYGFHIIQRAR